MAWVQLPPILGPGVFARAAAPDAPLARLPLSPQRRQFEFAVGRRCAAQALRDAGSSEVEVGVGAAREPIWPVGFVGSISHSEHLVGAAVVATRLALGIGIDFEPVFDEDAMRDVAPLAVTSLERGLPSELPQAAFATMVFSAKESLFKCLYPLARTFFEFDDARVIALDAGGAFRIELLRSLGGEFACGSVFDGRFAIEGPLVHTAIVLRH